MGKRAVSSTTHPLADINELYHQYRQDGKKELEDKLFEKIKLVTQQELRRRTRSYLLTFQDKEDSLQECYIIFKCLICLPILEREFEHQYLLEFRRFLRKNFKYKKQESLVEVIPDDIPDGKIVEYKEDKTKILSRISKNPKEIYVLKCILENRVEEKNFTLEQISTFYCVSLDKVWKLEQRLREEIRVCYD